MTTSSETSAVATADQFTYLPSVTGISPSSGPAAGGTLVTINGSGFTSASTVEFGAAAGTNVDLRLGDADQGHRARRSGYRGCHRDHLRRDVRYVNQRSIRLRAQRDGRQSEFGSGRRRHRRHDQRNRDSPPLRPSSLDRLAGTGVTYVSANEIKATAPAEAVGIADVTVTTSGGTSAISSRGPVHLRAERDQHQSEFGPGRRRHRRYDQWIGLHRRFDRRVWNNRRRQA